MTVKFDTATRDSYVSANAGKHLSAVDLDQFDWLAVWPEVDEDGILTGEITDGEGRRGVSLDENGDLVRDRYNPAAMLAE